MTTSTAADFAANPGAADGAAPAGIGGAEPSAPDAPRRGNLRRADKIMSAEEIDAFLGSARCGRTATVGSDGYPYIVPNLFVWMNGLLYLHTAAVEGHFLNNVRHSELASFEIDEIGEVYPYGAVECDTTVSYRSVILFGRIGIVADEALKTGFYAALLRKYAPPESWGREQGSFPRLAKTIVYAITPESITGKQGPLPPLAQRWPNKPATAAKSATAPTGASPVDGLPPAVPVLSNEVS